MIDIKGKGWHGGPMQVIPRAGGLYIRVDDDWNPELWFEVFIPAGLLLCMSAAVDVLRDEPTFNAAALNHSWGERKPDTTHYERVNPNACAGDEAEAVPGS